MRSCWSRDRCSRFTAGSQRARSLQVASRCHCRVCRRRCSNGLGPIAWGVDCWAHTSRCWCGSVILIGEHLHFRGCASSTAGCLWGDGTTGCHCRHTQQLRHQPQHFILAFAAGRICCACSATAACVAVAAARDCSVLAVAARPGSQTVLPVGGHMHSSAYPRAKP